MGTVSQDDLSLIPGFLTQNQLVDITDNLPEEVTPAQSKIRELQDDEAQEMAGENLVEPRCDGGMPWTLMFCLLFFLLGRYSYKIVKAVNEYVQGGYQKDRVN